MSNNLEQLYKKETRIRHITVWFFVGLHFTFLTSFTGSFTAKIIWVSSLLINFAFAFYVQLLFIWPQFDKKKWYSIFVLLGLTAFFLTIYCFQVNLLVPAFGGNLAWTGAPIPLMLNKFTKNYIFITFSSAGTYLNKKSVRDIKLTLKIEKNILERELLFLKNQFHSHLTFNFLNFCYNRFRLFSKSSTDSIEEFSDLLRYSMKYKSDDLTTLKKEFEYIKSYVSFQRHFQNELYINFNCIGDLNEKKIIPKILIVLLENAIKNSVVNDKNKPVNVFLAGFHEEINFKIEGVGKQKNLNDCETEFNDVTRILNFFYPNNYQVSINKGNEVFCWDLKLLGEPNVSIQY